MRLELMNDDGTIEVDGCTVHLVPSTDAEAFVDDCVKRAAVDAAVRSGDRKLAARFAALPVLVPDDQTIRVCFVTPESASDDCVLEILGDLAWADDGRQAPWLSEVNYVLGGSTVRGAREPFASDSDRASAAELVASVDGLSDAQRRRLLRRIADTPVLTSI